MDDDIEIIKVGPDLDGAVEAMTSGAELMSRMREQTQHGTGLRTQNGGRCKARYETSIFNGQGMTEEAQLNGDKGYSLARATPGTLKSYYCPYRRRRVQLLGYAQAIK